MIQVNYVAVVLSAIFAMVVGYIWYGPLFGQTWMKLVGISKESLKKKKMLTPYGVMFAGALVEAYILSIFIHYSGAYTIINGAKTGLWAWLGFVAPVMLGNYMFSKKPLKLFKIDAGYGLVSLLLMGATIAVMF